MGWDDWERSPHRRVRWAFHVTGAIGLALCILIPLALIAAAGVTSDPDYYGPRTGWTHLGNFLLYRCEGTTAVYRQDPEGSLTSVADDTRCAAVK